MNKQGWNFIDINYIFVSFNLGLTSSTQKRHPFLQNMPKIMPFSRVCKGAVENCENHTLSRGFMDKVE